MAYKGKYKGPEIDSKLDAIDGKQDELVSGQNIKTINGYSILGSGNISISGGGGEVGYSAKINLESPQYNAVLSDSTGHYIVFTFDTTNGAGSSMGEGVTCTYTITRGTSKQVITEKYRYNTRVRFSLDKYLQEGANDIVIKIVGDISGLSTTLGVTYQVVSLSLDASYDVSNVCDLSTQTSAVIEVQFKVSGYGTKIVEWYIDGEKLDFVKNDDEVVDVSTERTKYITVSNLAQGRHTLQLRAYTSVSGETFYSDTLYYDLLVYTGVSKDTLLGVAVRIPSRYGIVPADGSLKIYGVTQYVPYTFKFATYSPTMASATSVQVNVGGVNVGNVVSQNRIENSFIYTSKESGNKTLVLSTSTTSYSIPMVVDRTTMNIAEITSALTLSFDAEGKNNKSENKDVWSYGDYVGTFSGFNWNNTSGWVDGRLVMNAGSSFGISYAPLANDPTRLGKTIEIEWMTKNVTNDNAVICDLRGDNGVGILITATKVSMISADGVVVETEYKSEENVRVGFVINPASGSSNQRLSFIYANGVVSRGEKWSANDNYYSDKEILFTASEEAEISLKSIRIYDAALASDQMLNNFTLYRDTIEEMLDVYERNDVYYDGTATFSPEKMMGRLPVMIVTGDIPTLENTSDKDTQIVVDIEYNNLQTPSKNFKMKNAAMRPQGTSSMGYPKKNFRIYTQKVEGTILYDADGKEVESKLYSFTEKAQPVNCWCLKADYAESSGTHNTGIARLWNDALVNAQIDGEYKLRTQAQKIALESKYPYDVRTTIDGFPILLFYRRSENDDLIFIGKYNFNNDKSTESVFGFTDIDGFDNSKMQCWEILNNGNALALFTSTEGFDEGWSEAFESRYPDTKSPYTGDLKAFCEWMTNVSEEDFATQKWEHLNVYMMAAYWCYLMRHAAADQFVKNAMLTSEDGQHFYFILYDNDTINGLINTGHLRIKPTDTRETVDDSGEYVFAGHDSRLWNMLEADEEFKSIVSAVDNALYSAGISYINTIKMFDKEQADKWVERVYNQDAQYKYVGPYVDKGIDNLFMLQGKRDLHRKWWLAKRFSIYDAKYVSGTYKSQAVEIKCLNGTAAGQQFTVTAGAPLDYGFGINNVPREFGVALGMGESHTFTTNEVVNLGDPIRIYGAPNIAEIDLSPMADRLAVVTVANVYDEALGTKLTKLVMGNPNAYNYEVAEISGLKQASALEYLDIQGMTKILSLSLVDQPYFKTLKGIGSGISSVSFAKGAPVERLELPATVRALSLEQLPYLDGSNVILEDIAGLTSINVTACPNVTNDFDFVYDWYVNKTADNSRCSLVMDNVNWHLSHADGFMELLNLKTNGGTFSIKGKIRMDSIKVEQIYAIRDILGESSFDPNAEFYVDIPSILQIDSEESVLEGNSLQFTTSLYPYLEGTYTWSLESGRRGCSIDQNGLLTTEETALDTSDVVVKVVFVAYDGEVLTATKTVSVERRTYPQNIVIEGAEDPRDSAEYTWSHDTEGVNGNYSVVWSLEGSMTDYWRIASSDSERCVLEKTRPMPSSVSGSIKASIVREFDKGVASTGSLALSLPVVFPANATIIGNVNPLEKPYTYTWETTTEGVNGEFYAEWILSGDVTSVVEIASSDNESCTMRMLDAVTKLVDGLLTLNIRKSYDGTLVVNATKMLQALLEGVIITSATNAPLQKSLYDAGLVSNETYTLKEELARITDSQFSTLFNGALENLIYFNEFEYFTSVTTFPSPSSYLLNLIEITFPNSLRKINSQAFFLAKKLIKVKNMSSVTQIGENAFESCANLLDVGDLSNVTHIGTNAFSKCEKLETMNFSNSNVAPSLGTNVFGYNTSTYTGNKVANPKMYLSANAKGFDSGQWLDPLQNPSKCGFTIYGKLTIEANNPSAKFTITYTTIDGETKTINAEGGVSYLSDVQYDTNMTIRVIEGGIPEEGVEKTFVYNDNNNTHNFTFPVEGSWIVIDQNITDSMTMISGDVNGEHIQNILNNTHRYLGKYTASGKMTLCQLSDTDSTKYVDGTTASTTGSEGDVFVKLPRFWYSCLEESTDVWKIGFFFGDEAPTDSYWIEWDGNDLLGAYDGYITSSKMYSQSGRAISSKTSLSSSNTAATNRGAGFSTLPMKWYNILHLLYYARYGKTSFASQYASAIGTSYTTGSSNSVGRADSQIGNNFCGVEALVRSGLCNYIGNVLLDFVSTTDPRTHKWKITETDGSVREVSGTIEGGYVQKMVFGANADMIPSQGNGTSSQGFCVNFTRTASSNRAVYVSLGFQIYANVPNNNSAAVGRLAFRGDIIIQNDPAIFKSLTAIG